MILIMKNKGWTMRRSCEKLFLMCAVCLLAFGCGCDALRSRRLNKLKQQLEERSVSLEDRNGRLNLTFTGCSGATVDETFQLLMPFAEQVDEVSFEGGDLRGIALEVPNAFSPYYLTLRACTVDSSSLARISGLGNKLEILSLTNVRGVEPQLLLRTWSGMETLTAAYMNISDGDLQGAFDSTSIVRLNLMGTQVTGELFDNPEDWPRLKSLSLLRCPVSSRGLSSIVELPELQGLELSDTHIENVGQAPEKKLYLADLVLRRAVVSQELSRWFRDAVVPASLWAEGAAIAPADFIEMVNGWAEDLVLIDCRGVDMSSAGETMRVRDLSHIKVLYAQECQLKDDFVEALAALNTLVNVDISGNADISWPAVQKLFDLESLQNLTLPSHLREHVDGGFAIIHGTSVFVHEDVVP